MENFLLDLTSDTAYIAAVFCVFVMASILWWILAKKAQDYLDNYKKEFTNTASNNMSDMFMFVDPNQLFIINILAIIIFPVLTWFVFKDILTMLAVLGMTMFLPTLFYRSIRKKRLKRFEAQLPDALAMVSGAMRAGASLNIALEGLVKEQPAPISQEFELFLKEQRLGVDFDESLAKMEERIPLADFGMLVTALRINREVGGNLAETMESLGETLRRKATMEGKIDSLTAQGKLQGIVMTGLPVLLGFLLNLMEPEAMSKLWTTQIGWAVMAIIVVMEAMGYFMIQKITTIDV
jgi:tight adherence protein B